MIGLGTIINTVGIVVGGLFGFLFKKALNERIQDTLRKAVGVAVLFIGIAGALEGILVIKDGVVSTQHLLLIVVCMALGEEQAEKLILRLPELLKEYELHF